METRFEIAFYFIYGIRNEFGVQKLICTINVGLGATLSWSILSTAYQFK
jgi:hypothetical protein